MKIIVMSDSHNNYFSIEKVVKNFHGDLYIHLGDGERELNQICTKYPDKQFIHVTGNCDFASLSQDEILFCPDDKNCIFAVHGHKYGVKSSIEPLKKIARKKGANILLYGHTHARFNEYDDGLYTMNPGSISCPRDGNPPSFGIIDITPKGIVTRIIDL
ncbi:metallophosphoesterase family protein [Porcipelethomonas sp.]|uniref:metallophosphoesterase family protein n=1 Tax=Porcipelethomonas sp. TaxID=2981675 RepID=UPI003EF08C9B